MQQPNNDDRNRYSDPELKEFKELIQKKLDSARSEYTTIADSIQSIENTGYLTLEDGSTTEEKERLSQMAARQKKYIENLENALIRIENKTYGICKVTGKLISKERLRAVPHTTQSIEAKLQQYK
ncbi:MAG: TraR/DksA C4-type zinc finger protein [Bacteroidia bacterium]|nr:TraR/DksA C4-type zinc finger protein [Bacteroidia bacterium]MBP9181174.1 TraR/DksA C4-type zinc finger protein [Bacteroidia bacterium]